MGVTVWKDWRKDVSNLGPGRLLKPGGPWLGSADSTVVVSWIWRAGNVEEPGTWLGSVDVKVRDLVRMGRGIGSWVGMPETEDVDGGVIGVRGEEEVMPLGDAGTCVGVLVSGAPIKERGAVAGTNVVVLAVGPGELIGVDFEGIYTVWSMVSISVEVSWLEDGS